MNQKGGPPGTAPLFAHDCEPEPWVEPHDALERGL